MPVSAEPANSSIELAAVDVAPEVAVLVGGVSVEFNTNRSPEPVVALDRLDLEIPSGEFVAVIGASGCGKTTLLNLLAGVLQPTVGRVLVNGAQPTRPLASTSYMFARDALLPWRTVRRNVEFGLEHRGISRSERRKRSMELLHQVGLADFAQAYPRQLSQGMRQRVAIARTLAPRPELLLLDEPFAALDARTKLHIQQEFLALWESGEQSARTVVFVTHDLQEALLLADRVVVMLPRPGRLAVDRVIDLPRPRSSRLVEIMFTATFREQFRELFELLESDAAKADEELQIDAGREA